MPHKFAHKVLIYKRYPLQLAKPNHTLHQLSAYHTYSVRVSKIYTLATGAAFHPRVGATARKAAGGH